MENINQVTQIIYGKKQSTVANDNEDFTKMSDKKLLQICSHYGRQALMWRMKFIGLLPEVNRRKLYERKGFASIFEFGKRMAGLSEEQIRLALNLEKRFEDKPSLHEALVEGQISINKLARVVSIATSENEEFLAESAKVLSKSSLEVFVRDIRMARDSGNAKYGIGNIGDCHFGGENNSTIKNQNGLFEPQIDPKSLPGQTGTKWRSLSEQAENGDVLNDESVVELGCKISENSNLKFQLNNEVIEKLNELNKKGLDVNEILLKMLEKRDEEIAEEKAKVSAEVLVKETAMVAASNANVDGLGGHGVEVGNAKATSRYIPVKVKKVLKQEFGNKCSVKNCWRESKHIHHEVPFSLAGSHDPSLLAPLCREHHDIIHSVNSKYVAQKLR